MQKRSQYKHAERSRVTRLQPSNRVSGQTEQNVRTGLRHCLGLATATPTLAALRLAHEHTRAEHARHARTMRARLASRAHALTWQHTLARQKLDVMLEALATG